MFAIEFFTISSQSYKYKYFLLFYLFFKQFDRVGCSGSNMKNCIANLNKRYFARINKTCTCGVVDNGGSIGFVVGEMGFRVR